MPGNRVFSTALEPEAETALTLSLVFIRWNRVLLVLTDAHVLALAAGEALPPGGLSVEDAIVQGVREWLRVYGADVVAWDDLDLALMLLLWHCAAFTEAVRAGEPAAAALEAVLYRCEYDSCKRAERAFVEAARAWLVGRGVPWRAEFAE